MIDEDAGPQTNPRFATTISPEVVDFIVSNDNNSLFSNQPDILRRGQLRFRTAADAFGVSIVMVAAVAEDGSTSAVMQFEIVVNPIADDVEVMIPVELIVLRDRFNERVLLVETLPQREVLRGRMSRIIARVDADFRPSRMMLSGLQSELSALSGSALLPTESALELLTIVEDMLGLMVLSDGQEAG